MGVLKMGSCLRKMGVLLRAEGEGGGALWMGGAMVQGWGV